MGDRGQTATGWHGASAGYRGVYPMGDRGQTATTSCSWSTSAEFIRWEIGGKPQPNRQRYAFVLSLSDGRSGANRNRSRRACHPPSPEFIRWEIGGKPQLGRDTALRRGDQVYPMGDRGQTATASLTRARRPRVYPMGDRGQTATVGSPPSVSDQFIRWEIGGKPQPAISRRGSIRR